ncbi:hypothetical protein [Mycolicibacterium pallens]|uniref:Uncharacterized protein n=1 Tax=Mycolicibacterium pallens TaxID=370524 RepID=A0ABX8VSB2_9MYCO|nr:hypothetical protein [Mycolicibacterium pallens]QYL18961.1 hypothetical protein K0O64_10945 [Mycolicibacterium pallens]
MSVVAISHEDLEVRPGGSSHSGDQAQARVFEEILLRELDELESHAARLRTARSEHSEIRLRRDLQRFNTRINEVRRLLDALQRRFEL